ncbi:MAG: hypothetical protein ABEH58_08270, partial [Haloplanus sp.]
MSTTYHCVNCFEQTVTRPFDVSHISVTCPTCDSFERLVNESVVDQFRAFEETPPEAFDWDRLDRTEKFLVSERVARRGRAPEDIAVTD